MNKNLFCFLHQLGVHHRWYRSGLLSWFWASFFERTCRRFIGRRSAPKGPLIVVSNVGVHPWAQQLSNYPMRLLPYRSGSTHLFAGFVLTAACRFCSTSSGRTKHLTRWKFSPSSNGAFCCLEKPRHAWLALGLPISISYIGISRVLYVSLSMQAPPRWRQNA